MFVSITESLVLRGVSVRCDGQALNLRLGTVVEPTNVRPAAIGNSKCHPLSDYRPDTTMPAVQIEHPVPSPVQETEVGGAGRSQSAGALRRLVPASVLGSPAAGLFAVRQDKRSADRSAWRMPAGQTRPTTTRGTRGR